MDMRKYMVSLIGASVSAGVFPTFHQVFAADPDDSAGSDLSVSDPAVAHQHRHRLAAEGQLTRLSA